MEDKATQQEVGQNRFTKVKEQVKAPALRLWHKAKDTLRSRGGKAALETLQSPSEEPVIPDVLRMVDEERQAREEAKAALAKQRQEEEERLRYETEVGSFEDPMMKICGEIKQNLENNTYGFMIGDDTSGRLPTLVMKNVIDYVNDSKGRAHIETRFIQAGTGMKDDQVEEQFLQRILPEAAKYPGKKALLVTEYIQNGGTIRRLLGLFAKHNIPVDLAALYIRRDRYGDKPIAATDTMQIFEGQEIADSQFSGLDEYRKPPEIWDKQNLVGLRKPRFDYDPIIPIVRENPDAQESINKARRDVTRLATKIVGRLFSPRQMNSPENKAV